MARRHRRLSDAENRGEALDVLAEMEKHAAGPKEKFTADKMLSYLSVYSTLVTAASNTLPQLEHALNALKVMLGV